MPPTLSLIFDLAVAVEERDTDAIAAAAAHLVDLLGSEEAVARASIERPAIAITAA
jgi:hypothetical protein